MSRTPLVSICIPSYNHARFLPATLDAIFAQTFRDFEVVAVDDGSTDNSLEILKSYQSKHPDTMRVYTHEGGKNLGPSATENRGVQEARGIYWCGNDSDDISYPDRLERQVAFMQRRPQIAWIYGVCDFIDGDGKKLPGDYGKDLSVFPGILERLIMNCYIYPIMIRRACMIEAGPFEPGLAFGDWEYWIRLAARFPAAFLPGAVGAYRIHGGNSCSYLPEQWTPDILIRDLRRLMDVIMTLRRKAGDPKSELCNPRLKALLDLRQASLHLLLREKKAASVAAQGVFRDDPSMRGDLKQLARLLTEFRSVRLTLRVLRDYGYPPRWLVHPAFLYALLQVGVQRIGYRFVAQPSN